MKKYLLLSLSHLAAVLVGFAAGIYLLPILTAPDTPTASAVQTIATQATYRGAFRKDLQDSNAVHWGEGKVSVGKQAISLQGRVSPGPDYKLYLLPEFVETKADFMRLKSQAVRVGDVKTFENFIVPVPDGIDVSRYTTVVIWCETFSQFITAARYR